MTRTIALKFTHKHGIVTGGQILVIDSVDFYEIQRGRIRKRTPIKPTYQPPKGNHANH